MKMCGFRRVLIGAWVLAASTSFGSCRQSKESRSETVRDDLKGVAKATEKTAKDVGRATVDVGDDAWITTKVKSELTAQGFDPLQVHVDTAGHTVTLSGSVAAVDDARKAVALARAVKGVVGVEDHLFVKPKLPGR